MSGIVDEKGNKVIVVATLENGMKVSLTTKEHIEEFFDKYPSAQLDFIKAKGTKK